MTFATLENGLWFHLRQVGNYLNRNNQTIDADLFHSTYQELFAQGLVQKHEKDATAYIKRITTFCITTNYCFDMFDKPKLKIFSNGIEQDQD